MKTNLIINKKFPVVIHRFGDVWAVWFKNSSSFLLLQEPAFDILQLVINGNNNTEIKTKIRKIYGHSKSDTDKFVDEIIQRINLYNSSKTSIQVSKKNVVKNEVKSGDFKFSKNYRFGNTVLTIDYQDDWLQHLIHPSFMHLETNEQSDQTNHISCYRNKSLLILTHNDKLIEAFDHKTVEYYKGAVSQLVYSLIYKKPFSGWMCTLHASGVYQNNKAFIFSAAAGSGKSTVSAILKANGIGFISDDFIAAAPNGNVYPFPASISVKEGSFPVLSDYYPELREKTPEKASNGKMVRYLQVDNFTKKSQKGIPVVGFVFVNYKSGSGFKLSEVNKKEALQLLLKETWVNPKTTFVNSFFEWVEKTPFYRMTYSDNNKMIETIKMLLNDDH